MAKKKVKKKSANRINKSSSKEYQDNAIKPMREVGILATGELLSGKYCNVALIKHTPREFVFDFLLAIENERVLISRIITNPKHAKKVHEVLGNNIKKYEEQHGTIKP
jgi:hypothetical protein